MILFVGLKCISSECCTKSVKIDIYYIARTLLFQIKQKYLIFISLLHSLENDKQWSFGGAPQIANCCNGVEPVLFSDNRF